jgi:hypothetical protein
MLRLSYVNTMRGLESGLRVQDIAVFDLQTCHVDETIGQVQRRVARFGFDNVPVRRDGVIVGVVENIRELDPEASPESCATPLSEHMLIAGSVPLKQFLPRIADRAYRLVISENGISGVVTPSDVVQLPVRLLVFALVAHLEELMRTAIRQVEPDDAKAVAALGKKRRDRVEGTLRSQAKKDLNPAPLDVTQFIDKANLLFNLRVVPERGGDRELFQAFYDLRNKVDHVDQYAETPTSLREFLHLVAQLEEWIGQLSALIPEDSPAVAPPRPRAEASSKQFYTQAARPSDFAAGRLRMPRETKSLLPATQATVAVTLRGEPLGPCAWNPRTVGKERSGTLSVGRAAMDRLVEPDEALVVSVDSASGAVFLDRPTS